MSENPYDPPSVAETDSGLRRTSKVSLPGRYLTTTVIGIVTGLAIGATLLLLNPFLIPGLFMFAACTFCVFLLRGLEMSLTGQAGLVAAMTVASYLLFIPICTASGFAATAVGFQEEYGPNELGLQLASLFSSVLVLNLVVTFAVYRLNKNAKLESPVEDVSANRREPDYDE